ncbi:hypothetical protein L3i22_062080 [Actinoplanes sp. L3-i22]|nr:hypothetical protein L3i22_062080 [Actinoplanes sp. L3-i22]
MRHAHATELINAGVSIETARRRLGHASTETTQIYALLYDKVADIEIRAARRRSRATGVGGPGTERGLASAAEHLVTFHAE